MINMTCPGCNASLNVDENRDVMFCEYCGHKIMLNNKTEHIERKIDEAAIRAEERKEKDDKNTMIMVFGVLGFLFLLFIISLLV